MEEMGRREREMKNEECRMSEKIINSRIRAFRITPNRTTLYTVLPNTVPPNPELYFITCYRLTHY